MPIQLALQVKLQCPLLRDRHRAAMTLLDGRPICPQERINVDCLISVQLLNLRDPIIPTQGIIELTELLGHRPDKKLRIAEPAGLPPERIGSVEIDIAMVFAERAAVDCKKAANRIVGHQVETIGSSLVPLRERAAKPRMLSRAEHTKPTVINEDAGGVVCDGTHRASRRHLGCQKGSVSGRTVSSKDFDWYRRFADPLLHERPSRFLAINQFG